MIWLIAFVIIPSTLNIIAVIAYFSMLDKEYRTINMVQWRDIVILSLLPCLNNIPYLIVIDKFLVKFREK